jgi:hypothetical protein
MIAPVGTLGGETGAGKRANHTGKFTGTNNPRDLRVISALQKRSLPRKTLDQVAGASNGPDLVMRLRSRGLEIPCMRIEAIDRDGKLCWVGVYHLTKKDRRLIVAWLNSRSAS